MTTLRMYTSRLHLNSY